MKIKLAYEGWYRLLVSKPGKSPHKDTGWFKNLITDQGLNYIGNPQFSDGFGTRYINVAVAVGTGTTAPTNADTTLETQGAYYYGGNTVSTSISYVAGPPTYWKTVYTYNFGVGDGAGTWSEVGVGYYSGSGDVNVFSRQLIVDGGGSPTTITILSDEILTVVYELRCYFVTSDTAYSFMINGTDSYSGVYRPMRVSTASSLDHGVYVSSFGATLTVYSGSIGATTSSPSGTTKAYQNNWKTYTLGNYYREIDLVAQYNEANFTITALSIATGIGNWQFSVSPGIPKDSDHKLTLTFRVSWDRYTP